MKLVSNVSALQLFHVMRFGVLLLIGMVLVKAGYSTSEIGLYELFFFLSNFISFFWVMGLNNGLISYFPSLTEENSRTLLFNLGILLIILAVIASLSLIFFRGPIAHLAGIGEGTLPLLGWIIAYLILSAPGNFTEYYLLLINKPRQIIGYGTALFSLQLMLIILGVLMDFQVKGLVQLMVLWAALKFIYFCIIVMKQGSFHINFKMQWLFLSFSFPLILHMLLGNGMEYVDGFLVNYFFDTSAFAQFRYGARELPLVTVLVGAVSTALIPIAVNDMNTAMRDVKRRMTHLSNILFPVSIVLMLASPFLFTFFYNENYQLSAQIFNIYLLVISSRLLMPQVVIFAKHENRVLVFSALLELIVNVGLSLWFLKWFGILGIAWATVIAYLVNKVILAVYSWQKYNIDLHKYLNMRQYTMWLSLLVISYFISTLYNG